MNRLVHDAAHEIAVESLKVIENLLRPEERLDALQEFYQVAKAGIEAFCIQQSSQKHMLNPMSN